MRTGLGLRELARAPAAAAAMAAAAASSACFSSGFAASFTAFTAAFTATRTSHATTARWRGFQFALCLGSILAESSYSCATSEHSLYIVLGGLHFASTGFIVISDLRSQVQLESVQAEHGVRIKVPKKGKGQVRGLGPRPLANLQSRFNTNWESHGGLPNHQGPSDPHICAVNLQNLFGCHGLLQLRGLLNTDNVAYPICVASIFVFLGYRAGDPDAEPRSTFGPAISKSRPHASHGSRGDSSARAIIPKIFQYRVRSIKRLRSSKYGYSAPALP